MSAFSAKYVYVSVGSPRVGCLLGGGGASAGTGTMGVHSPFFFGVLAPPLIGRRGPLVERPGPYHLRYFKSGFRLAETMQIGRQANQIAAALIDREIGPRSGPKIHAERTDVLIIPPRIEAAPFHAVALSAWQPLRDNR